MINGTSGRVLDLRAGIAGPKGQRGSVTIAGVWEGVHLRASSTPGISRPRPGSVWA